MRCIVCKKETTESDSMVVDNSRLCLRCLEAKMKYDTP